MTQNEALNSDIYLETHRLTLRNLSETDLSQIVLLANDMSVAEMMNGSIAHPYALEEAKKWVAKHVGDSTSSPSISWAISVKESGQFIGSVQLRSDRGLRTARLSYWIGLPFRNRGFMKEALKGVISFGFGKLKLKGIEADHLERNSASGAILKSVGFQHVRKVRKLDKFSNREEWFEDYFLGQII